MRVMYGPGGDVEPAEGLAVRLRALGAGERAARSAEGRQPEVRTCTARESTELKTPEIRSVSALHRSTAAWEVSR